MRKVKNSGLALLVFVFLILFPFMSFGETIGYKDLYLGMSKGAYEELLLSNKNTATFLQSKQSLVEECKRRAEFGFTKESAEKYSERLTKECFDSEIESVLNRYCAVGRIKVTFEDDDIYPKLANPKLVKIEIIPFREDGFREATYDKWGKPDKTETEEYQNTFGVKRYGYFDVWHKQTALISLRKIYLGINKSILVYTLITLEQAKKELPKKPKIGL